MVTIKGRPTYQQRTSKSSGRPYKVWTFDDTNGHHYSGVYLGGAIIAEGDQIDLRQTDKGWEIVKELDNSQNIQQYGTWKDQEHPHIRAQWAIGQAMQALCKDGKEPHYDNVENVALTLFEMVDRVKVGRTEEVVKDAGDFKMINPIDENPEEVPVEARQYNG